MTGADRGRPPTAPPVRTGIDVQSISRFEALSGPVREGVYARTFSAAERSYCEGTGRPAQHFAARWAAKEAASKVLGGAVPLSAVEVRRGEHGPRLALSAAARAALKTRLGTPDWETAVSLSHDPDADVAAAQVVATGGWSR